ncbi:MAG: PEP-CTERM sorting domain-containing protein [Limisphaerales bacterium]
MKKLIMFAVCVSLSLAAMAQGTLNFANGAPGVNAPIRDGSLPGSPLADGANYVAQLFTAPLGTTDTNLFTLVSTTAAGTPLGTGATAGFFFGGEKVVPTVAGGLPGAAFQVRAFKLSTGATYATATVRGQSIIFPLQLASPPAPAVPLTGLGQNGFTLLSTVVVPEPSTIALGVLGAGALLFRLRRK